LKEVEAVAADAVAKGVDPTTPAAIVDNGARSGQRVVVGTLASLGRLAREAALRGPTITIVGSVVTLREKLDWFGKRAER
jgi:siroheme synthase